MALTRGTLTSIDRRVFAELSRSCGVQAAKVPVSAAVWSVWRRYCEAIGLSMGEGVAALIAHEVETVVRAEGNASDVFAEQIARQAGERASRLDAREQELGARAERLRNKEAHLTAWEHRIRTERMSEATSKGDSRASTVRTKIGRNERCPCGSDLKYKRCHGLSGRRT
ncbi:MAG: SEC-C metal-binding domain-containing protein [Actinomycetia bacterium]|nr:SEC-C metal-binding domain-containing protein [Actinomycetes bacterium]